MCNTSADCLTEVQEMNVSARIKRLFTAKSQEGGFCDLQGIEELLKEATQRT